MRVLGLDISPHAIACVEIDTAFGRFEIRDTHESVIDPNVDPTSINPIGAAQQLLLSLHRKVDRLVISIPPEIGTFRNLQIGSKDKRAIKLAVDFELEDDLPFERDNLHYDSVTLPPNPDQPGATIHVSAVKKESFEAYLGQLHAFQIDPDVLTSDAWAYRSLLTRMVPKESAPVLLIGFERDVTFFYIHYQGKPILYKEISFGIRTIERLLAEQLGANASEIKNWIQDVGVSGIDQKVSRAIADVLENLIPELKQIELSARGSVRSAIEQIYVTGDGALLPGFLNWLEENSFKRVSLFKPLSAISPSQVNYSDLSEIRYAKALALAMAAIPFDKINPINLRKGEFAKTNANTTSAMDFVKKPLPYVLITLAVFLGTKTIEYNYYKGKVDDSEEILKRAVKNYFGGISDGAARTYVADTNKLKKTIESDLARERELSKLFTANTNSPFDFLKELSQKIGKDIVLDMSQFDVASDLNEPYKENRSAKTSITVLVANAQMLARLNDVMEKTFNLRKGNSEEVTQEGRKLFKVNYSGVITTQKR
jgi:Tfp pilus assembly PilM family ATPase